MSEVAAQLIETLTWPKRVLFCNGIVLVEAGWPMAKRRCRLCRFVAGVQMAWIAVTHRSTQD